VQAERTDIRVPSSRPPAKCAPSKGTILALGLPSGTYIQPPETLALRGVVNARVPQVALLSTFANSRCLQGRQDFCRDCCPVAAWQQDWRYCDVSTQMGAEISTLLLRGPRKEGEEEFLLVNGPAEACCQNWRSCWVTREGTPRSARGNLFERIQFDPDT